MDETIAARRMVISPQVELNAGTLEREIAWFSEVLDTRLKIYFGQETEFEDITEIVPPDPLHTQSNYAALLKHYNMSFEERITLMLAMVVQIRPETLDVFFVRNAESNRGFTEFGGIKSTTHACFIPTAETLLFILAGDDLAKRISLEYLFSNEHFFSMHNLVTIEPVREHDPYLSGILSVSKEILHFLTAGKSVSPNYNQDFPARRITTSMDWEDLVLEEQTLQELDEVRAWMEHEHTIMHEWGMSRTLKPGYKALFFGPPGTGKTLTAALLGKVMQRDVYRIDLSLVVSKYIGETEKNLAKVFAQAEHKNWILFFDEADALFGKRTKVEDAHDRYANQEVSYLLQRIEDFEGVIVLASNFKSNLDDAFTRRFQSVISFPMPQPSERLVLWEKAFSEHTVLEPKIRLQEIAQRYELSGGAMMNVVRYCSLMALRRGGNIILLSDIEEGIRREFRKEGRTV